MNVWKHFFALTLAAAFALTAEAQDWANLNRFREDNATLGAAGAGDSGVVFMGNSITQGWKEAVPGFFEGRPYINRGISGQTTPQMLLRFRQDVLSLRPGVVVILAGTNDIAGNTGPSTPEMIMDNLRCMTELAQMHGISVVLCSVLPAFDYPWRPGLAPAPVIAELNSLIREYAEEGNAVYCDFHTRMADGRGGLPQELSEDGVHPGQKGYALMGPLVEEAIARAVQSKIED